MCAMGYRSLTEGRVASMSHSKLQSQLCSQLISKTHNNERAQSKEDFAKQKQKPDNNKKQKK